MKNLIRSVILGIDWPSRKGAHLDFYHRSLGIPGGEQHIFIPFDFGVHSIVGEPHTEVKASSISQVTGSLDKSSCVDNVGASESMAIKGSKFNRKDHTASLEELTLKV